MNLLPFVEKYYLLCVFSNELLVDFMPLKNQAVLYGLIQSKWIVLFGTIKKYYKMIFIVRNKLVSCTGIMFKCKEDLLKTYWKRKIRSKFSTKMKLMQFGKNLYFYMNFLWNRWKNFCSWYYKFESFHILDQFPKKVLT